MTARRKGTLLAALAGLGLALSHPFTAGGFSLWPLAWVSLVPLLWALRSASPRAAFGYGWVAGWVMSFGTLFWLGETLELFTQIWLPLAYLSLALHAVFRGLQLALFGGLYRWLGDRRGRELSAFAVAALFVVIEHLFPFIFPTTLGPTQHRALPVIQVADLAGTAGVAFVIIVVNTVLYRGLAAWRGKTALPWRELLAAGLLLAATLVYGVVRIASVEAATASAPTIKLGVVQPNIDVFSKEAKHLSGRERVLTLQGNLLKLQTLSAKLEAEGAEVIIWPEIAFVAPGYKQGKSTPHFAAGITATGQLALWSDMGDSLAWSVWNESSPGGPLRAVAAAREDAVCGVGVRGAAACWDGQHLRGVAVDGAPELRAVSVVYARDGQPLTPGSPVEVWAAGDDGVLLGGDVSRLNPVPSGTDKHLRAMTFFKPGEGLVVGDGGTLVTVAEGKVLATASLGPEDLFAAWAPPDLRGAWLGGAGGTIHVLGSDGWSRAKTGTTATLRAFAGTSSADVWAVGDRGTVLRRALPDTAWQPIAPPAAGVDLVAASTDGHGTLLVASADGRVWAREAAAWRPLALPEGAGGLVALALLPFNTYHTVPRDVRYLSQSQAPLPPTPDAATDDAARFDFQRNAVQRGFRTPVVFGAMTLPGAKDGYNSAIGLDAAGRVVGIGDKVDLVPIAETLPRELVYGLGSDGIRDLSLDLYSFIPEATQFAAGAEPGVIALGAARMGVLICYEDILPHIGLRLAAKRPNLLLNLTNDAWFGETAEPYTHLGLATLRSVELRRAMVRGTQTGVSALIHPTGEIVAETAMRVETTMVLDAPLLEGQTVYARVGDLFVWLCLAGLLLLGGRAWWEGRRRGPSA